MATQESNHATRASQLTPQEMTALAARLRARAESVLLRDQPEQQSDLRATAALVDKLMDLHGIIRTAVADIERAMSRLIEHVGGA